MMGNPDSEVLNSTGVLVVACVVNLPYWLAALLFHLLSYDGGAVKLNCLKFEISREVVAKVFLRGARRLSEVLDSGHLFFLKLN